MTFGFSGYLLPMDELAYFATKVGLEIPASGAGGRAVPGGPDSGRTDGGREHDPAVLHAARRDSARACLRSPCWVCTCTWCSGTATRCRPAKKRSPHQQRQYIKFFPDFLVKDLAMWLMVLNLLGVPGVPGPVATGRAGGPGQCRTGRDPSRMVFHGPVSIAQGAGRLAARCGGRAGGMLIVTVGGILLGRCCRCLIVRSDEPPRHGLWHVVQLWPWPRSSA